MEKTKYNANDAYQASINFDVPETAVPAEETVSVTAAAVERPSWDLRFISFGSGSSGNCSYLGTEKSGILIDAGVDMDHVFADLQRNGVRPDNVKGIILTHDHSDHIRFAYKIVRRYKHIRIYCTPRLLNGMLRHHNISSRIRDYHEPVFKEITFHLAGLAITAFDTSHDGADNMGFHIAYNGHNFVVGTDMGVITERASYYMSQADFLMIESNYDAHMLDTGRYPALLKARVRSEKGHLDNVVATQFVASKYSPKNPDRAPLKNIFLCHLSNDNNTPEIALKVMTEALEAEGLSVGDASNTPDQRDRDVQLYALPRYDTSPLFVL